MIDRRHFVYALATMGGFAFSTRAARGRAEDTGQFKVHEPTEIAWIIAGLSPLGKGDGGVIRRDTPYFAAVEHWFAPVSKHPVFAALGSDFNLPRLVGNAADYRFGAAGRLEPATDAAPLWDDKEGDLFTKHRAAIEDFARRSNARRFLKQQRRTLAGSNRTLHAAVDVKDIQTWLEGQFSERSAPVQILVSPMTDGWNWTNLGGKQPRVWVPEPKSASLDDPVKRFITVSSVFTEVDHIYVNPVTTIHAAAVETVFAKAKGWATDAAWADYESAALVFNEYMTWAVFFEYARERMPPTGYDSLAGKIIKFMEKSRGFARFGDFVAVVRRVRGVDRQTLQATFPAIIAACQAR
jgi:hypothetical protein